MRLPSLSERGRTAPASPIRRLAPLADAAKERGVKVHHLNIGQPDIPTPPSMVEAYRGFNDKVLAYSPSDGFIPYRKKLAAYYNTLVGPAGGRPIDANDIVVTVGGSEALLFVMSAVCDPGDEVLVVEPFYTNYAGFAHLCSVVVRPVTTYAAEGYRLDPKRIEAAITPRTRAIVVPTPGNPTGVVLSARELGELAEICLTRGLYFVSDEVYRDFVYDQGDAAVAPSVLSLPDFDQHAVVVDSVSKRYSACGARIGALVTKNAALRSAALRFGQARLSPPTVDQWAGMAALDTPPEYMLEVVREYRQRRDTLVSGLRAIGVQCHSPAGAFYLMATLPVSDADAFCRFLLEDFALDGETVMLAPASGFYATPGLGKDEVRLAYVLECGKLSRCCEILGAALHAYGDR